MPAAKHKQLEKLLRASADTNTEATLSESDDPVARRLALYAEFLRLAPPPPVNSVGRLLLSTDAGEVRVIPLGGTPVEIGRGTTCSVHLADPETSRRHCRVGADAEGTWLEDLSSANGTWLNDRRVSGRVPLCDGDVIRVGRTLLVFARP